jgi:peptidoglycan/LPS O-acetylase OafA/YrhL
MMKPNLGRLLSVLGAIVIVVSLALVWYHIDRLPSQGDTSSTGWDSFPRLRIILLASALLTVASAFPSQRRPVLIARSVLGLLLAALVLRRIVDPPDLTAPVIAQPGVYAGLLGAIAVALGGLVDTGRRAAEAYPGLGLRPNRALPPAGDARVRPRPDDIEAPGGGNAVRVPNHAIRGR